jgi:hypothetical protein
MKYLVAIGLLCMLLTLAVALIVIIVTEVKYLITDCGIKVKKIKLKGWY